MKKEPIYQEILTFILNSLDLNSKDYKTIKQFRKFYLLEGPARLDLLKILNKYKISRKKV